MVDSDISLPHITLPDRFSVRFPLWEIHTSSLLSSQPLSCRLKLSEHLILAPHYILEPNSPRSREVGEITSLLLPLTQRRTGFFPKASRDIKPRC